AQQPAWRRSGLANPRPLGQSQLSKTVIWWMSVKSFLLLSIRRESKGVTAGYSVYPTDSPWHRDAIVFGASGLR
ncbi:MAG: hypothetical protein WA884_01760, partial [Methyloceanibacter sp.]